MFAALRSVHCVLCTKHCVLFSLHCALRYCALCSVLLGNEYCVTVHWILCICALCTVLLCAVYCVIVHCVLSYCELFTVVFELCTGLLCTVILCSVGSVEDRWLGEVRIEEDGHRQESSGWSMLPSNLEPGTWNMLLRAWYLVHGTTNIVVV